jgi:hypothetical protein
VRELESYRRLARNWPEPNSTGRTEFQQYGIFWVAVQSPPTYRRRSLCMKALQLTDDRVRPRLWYLRPRDFRGNLDRLRQLGAELNCALTNLSCRVPKAYGSHECNLNLCTRWARAKGQEPRNGAPQTHSRPAFMLRLLDMTMRHHCAHLRPCVTQRSTSTPRSSDADSSPSSGRLSNATDSGPTS